MPFSKTLCLLIFFTSCTFAQALKIPSIEFNPPKYICYRTTEAITIDGKLNEAVWLNTEWTTDFVDIEDSLKPLPRFRTRVKMLWDKDYFYIGAEVQEPDIWATLTKRDDIIFYDNDFEIFIDPDGNTHRYCEFEINALNTFWDLLLVQPYRDINKAAVHDWDIKGLKTGVAVFGTLNKPGDKDSCWTVEVAFPWDAFKENSSVSLPPVDKEQWRINFSRVEWRTEVHDGKYQKTINSSTKKPYAEDNWVWSPQGVVNMHYPEMWGYVQFSAEPVGGRKISFVKKSEELAKWRLRLLYYKERNYFAEHGAFTNDLKKIGFDAQPIPGFSAMPVVQCTPHMFEACLKSDDGSMSLYIRNDGLVWKEQGK